MDLVLDFGNTNKKFALFEKGSLVHMETFPEVIPDLVKKFVTAYPGIQNCILSSVILHPAAVTNFLRKRYFFIELGARTPVPVINCYQTPETLGNDRLASAVAGHQAFPRSNVLVINAGTCITYDFINSVGEYLGGSISPGMEMRFRALNTFTGKLPLVTYKKGVIPLAGKDTATSVRSGVINGIAAEMENIAGRYRKEYPGLKLILSGGDLDYFAGRLKISIFALPEIVIAGLYEILRFNVEGN
jgi:type III pantothenate kinase